MTENESKTMFARASLATPGDWWAAAFAVFPNDGSKAMIASKQWRFDAFVLSEIERLKKDGVGMDLLDKDQQAYMLQKIANNENYSVDDRLKAHRLLAEIRGHIEKPTVNNGIINNTNKVMAISVMVDSKGKPVDEETWEMNAEAAQAELQHEGYRLLEGS